MSAPARDRTAIEKNIRKAFSSNSYPGDECIANGAYFEAEDTREAFRGKRWEDIVGNIKFTDENYVAFSFFTNEAFAYFLPAFLLNLLDFDSSDMTSVAVMSIFEPRSDLTFRELTKRHLRSLNDDQLSAVIQYFAFLGPYLESIGEDYDGDRCKPIVGALEKYQWMRE